MTILVSIPLNDSSLSDSINESFSGEEIKNNPYLLPSVSFSQM